VRHPLLAPSVALCAGVVAARYVPFSRGGLLVATALLAALAALAWWKASRPTALVAGLTAVFFLGALTAVLHRLPPRPELDATSREVVILSGCVVVPPAFSEGREQFTLELAPGARARVSFYERPGVALPDLRYGQRLELDARVRRTHNFGNPGSFDYAGYLARQGIYWTASGRAGSVRLLPGGCGSPLAGVVYTLRGAALERLQRLYSGDSYQTAMMQAILIGESAGLQRVWTQDFRRTGTYHALVISGMHVAVLAAFLLFLMRIVFVPAPVAIFLTTLAGWLYALVAGWQPPVVRAAAGFTLYAVASWFYRRPRVLNLLAAVVIAFLLLDPEQLFDASFQLSFLCVAAIGALAAPLLERTTAPLTRGLAGLADCDRDLHLEPRVAHFRVELRLLAETLALWARLPARAWLAAMSLVLRAVFWVCELFIISAAVQFGLALPMAVYFHRLSITGLTANLLIVPLMSAVVPVGFVAIFTNWKLPAALAAWLLTASETVAQWHLRWEPDWRIPVPPLWLAVCLVASIVAVTLTTRRLRLGALAVSLAALAVLVWHPFAPRVEPGALELTAIDVGQGESLFIAFPGGKLMLLDGGGIAVYGGRRRPQLDIGEDVVSPYLWTRSIRRLDAVALSHPHEDHIGGIAAVIDNFRPRELWVGSVADLPDWRRVEERAAARGVRIVHLAAGRRFDYGGARVEVLAPPPDHVPSASAPNNDSLVLRLTYGRHSFLLTGDIDRRVERELIGSGALGPAAVLKVAHHGSRTSTTEPFLELVRPAFAVISSGYENSFDNPHPDVLKRLEQHHALVLRTDLCGLVTIRTDGRRFRSETMCPAGGRPGLYDPF